MEFNCVVIGSDIISTPPSLYLSSTKQLQIGSAVAGGSLQPRTMRSILHPE